MSRHADNTGSGPSPGRRRRPPIDRLWGLLSLLILLALLVGVPAALIALRGNPLPNTALKTGAVYRALCDTTLRRNMSCVFVGAV